MPSNEGMIVHSQKDMQSVMSFLNSLSLTGIEAARKLATAATILESGKPLEEYLKSKKGSDQDGITEQDEQSSNGTV